MFRNVSMGLLMTPTGHDHVNVGGKSVQKCVPADADDSLFKILYQIVFDASEKWTMPMRDWDIMLNQLMAYFGERVDFIVIPHISATIGCAVTNV